MILLLYIVVIVATCRYCILVIRLNSVLFVIHPVRKIQHNGPYCMYKQNK